MSADMSKAMARPWRQEGRGTGMRVVFAVLKRALIGVYHHVEPKHLHRYVNEFAFRLNEGSVERHTMDRIESFVAGTAGKRLTYKAYIQ